MNRKDLGLGDHDLDVHVILHRRDLAVLSDGAELAHRFNGLLERGAVLRGGGDLVFPDAAQHADPKAAHAVAKPAMKVRDRLLDTVAVGRVVSGDCLEHDGAVFDCPGHRPAVV